MISDLVRHNLVGNARSRRVVGVSRGATAGMLIGIMNAVMLFVPIPAETKVELNVALGPVLSFGAFYLFAWLDESVKGKEVYNGPDE